MGIVLVYGTGKAGREQSKDIFAEWANGFARKEKKLLPSSDQRRFRRYALQFPCVVRPKEGRKRPAKSGMGVQTRDVSRGGLYFVAEADWKVGTKIECFLELPLQMFGGRPAAIRCSGKIARVVPEAEGRIGVGATIESFQFVPLGRELEKGR